MSLPANPLAGLPARLRALIVIAAGAGLHAFNWVLSSGIVMGYAVYSPTITVLGWVMIAIGIGGLVHGAPMTDQKPGPIIGAYAIAGLIAAGAHLYLLGLFDDIVGLFR
jgi:hypothetical protein